AFIMGEEGLVFGCASVGNAGVEGEVSADQVRLQYQTVHQATEIHGFARLIERQQVGLEMGRGLQQRLEHAAAQRLLVAVVLGSGQVCIHARACSKASS